MLWGRLNASESLIRALVPEEHPDFETLIDEAHRIIVREFAADQDPPVAPERSWDWFLNEYEPRADRSAHARDPRPRRGRDRQGRGRRGAREGRAGLGLAGLGAAPEPWRAPGGHARRARLLLRTTPGLVALVAWLLLVVAGIALIATDANLALGIVLLVVAAALAGALLVGLWLAISKLRAALEKRVGAFVFGRP